MIRERLWGSPRGVKETLDSESHSIMLGLHFEWSTLFLALGQRGADLLKASPLPLIYAFPPSTFTQHSPSYSTLRYINKQPHKIVLPHPIGQTLGLLELQIIERIYIM